MLLLYAARGRQAVKSKRVDDGTAVVNPPGLTRSLCPRHGAKRCRYSMDERNALTISDSMKLPPNWLSFPSQKS